jgi:two-component system, NtrC family, nitrogen regulation sensor histidine kinase NtrY
VKLPGRFEWKILGIVLLVTALSTGTVAYALTYVLGGFVESSRQERRTGRVSAEAEKLFRAYFDDRKEEFRRRAATIARTRPARLADLEGTDALIAARRLQDGRVVEEWRASDQSLERLREGSPVVVELPPSEDGAGAQTPSDLELTFGIPKVMYEGFLEMRDALEFEKQRGQAFEAFVSSYVSQYVVFVVALLIVMPLVGLYFARRATRRVTRLSEAARRVGEGDLSIRIEPTGKDELDELARAFDGMVEELSDTRSRLEYLQKVSAWQEVARRLAHEIKNPLTPIQLSVQELVSKYRGGDPAYQRLLDTAAEISKEEITALRRLVDDFSAFAKLPKVEPVPIELGVCLADFARRHPEFQGCLEVEPGHVPVTVPCDRILFGRVLTNLVENAVQAAEGAGVAPRVRLSISPTGRPVGAMSLFQVSREMPGLTAEARAEARGRKRAAILIDDNGPGVPVDKRKTIFDPYITTKPHGTGLGLAIVRKILLDHGGDVSVASTPSPLGGARFMVELPVIE